MQQGKPPAQSASPFSVCSTTQKWRDKEQKEPLPVRIPFVAALMTIELDDLDGAFIFDSLSTLEVIFG